MNLTGCEVGPIGASYLAAAAAAGGGLPQLETACLADNNLGPEVRVCACCCAEHILTADCRELAGKFLHCTPRTFVNVQRYCRRHSPQPTDRSSPCAAARLPAGPGLTAVLTAGRPLTARALQPAGGAGFVHQRAGRCGVQGVVRGRAAAGRLLKAKQAHTILPLHVSVLVPGFSCRAAVHSPKRCTSRYVAHSPSAQDLCRSLPLLGGTGLRVLVMSHNGIGTEGARALAAALPSCTSLQVRHSAPQKCLHSCPAAGSLEAWASIRPCSPALAPKPYGKQFSHCGNTEPATWYILKPGLSV